MMPDREIEARFLEIDVPLLVQRLSAAGAEDRGERLLEETIFYDKGFEWRDKEEKFVRIRKDGGRALVSYKHHRSQTVDGTEEVECEVSDAAKAEALFEKIGLVAYRRQQKRRHTFRLGAVVVDIDTWPRVPPYVELEGRSEEALKEAAAKIGLDWSAAVFKDAGTVIEDVYHIPVKAMQWFTFDRFE